MNFLKKIFKFFFKEKTVYTYDKLIKDRTNIDVILPDIVSYNKNISKILSNNNILEDTDYKFVPKISSETIKTTILYCWCVDTNGKRLLDLNKEIYLFLNLSEELIKQFNIMKKLKENDNLFKFNIRQLQPYIINLEDIRKELMMK